MTALAMILTAAMADPGNGPDRVSAEMEQGLDLSGEWEGTWEFHRRESFRIKLTPTEFHIDKGESTAILRNPIIFDEGKNKLRLRGSLGIYQQDGDRLLICVGGAGINQCPTSFRIGDGQSLLSLHRVKPRK